MFSNKINSNFIFEETNLKGVYLIQPFVRYDERGYFLKDYSKIIFNKNNIEFDLKEVFYASSQTGVLRGLHFQRVKQQSKLVRCVVGEIYDVVVDLRKDSETFGEWRGFYLSEINKKELFIPEGFGHGYLTLKPSIVSYKCGEDFYQEYDDGIIWNDTDIGIDWPLHLVNEVIISPKDKNLQTFKLFNNN